MEDPWQQGLSLNQRHRDNMRKDLMPLVDKLLSGRRFTFDPD